MVINTFYWDPVALGKYRGIFSFLKSNNSPGFRHGNAGDLFARDILRRIYDSEVRNTEKGPRILSVGSIAHKVKDGDIICGVGVKSPELMIPSISRKVEIFGVRGPLSERVLRVNGFDTKDIRFQLDPGLLLRFFFSESQISEFGSDIIFIPHYRERHIYKEKPPIGVRVVDIDSNPIDIGRQILSSKLVFSSSLHGIIFSHTLGRPTIFVRPKTSESIFKYEDYYLSIGQSLPRPVENVDLKIAAGMSDSPINLNFSEKDFSFPSIEKLLQTGIAG